MGIREKYILYCMIKNRLLATVQIPRGTGMSIERILLACDREAFKRTNYILYAIGESFDEDDIVACENCLITR